MEFLAKNLVEHVNKLLINSVSCVNAAAQFAGIAALDGPDDSINEMMEKFTAKREILFMQVLMIYLVLNVVYQVVHFMHFQM